jgi:hypothetical protein
MRPKQPKNETKTRGKMRLKQPKTETKLEKDETNTANKMSPKNGSDLSKAH